MMQNGLHGPRQLLLPPPSHHKHTLAQPVIEALRRGSARLRDRADQMMAAGHLDVAAWLEEQAALAEHQAGLIQEEPLGAFRRN